MDLYLATRSDAPHLLNIGRNSNAHSRCRQLQHGHCFSDPCVSNLRGNGRLRGSCPQGAHGVPAQQLATDMLTAVETIQKTQPQRQRARRHNLEELARRRKLQGRTFKSTRHPSLNEPA